VKVIDWRTRITFASFCAPWSVSPREMLTISRTKFEPLGAEESAGTYFSWTSSVSDADGGQTLAKNQKGYMRGTLHYAGLWIEPVKGEQNRCKVVYVVSSDPNGSIPKAIVNAVNVKQPLCIANIQKFMSKNPDIVAIIRKAFEVEKQDKRDRKAAYRKSQGKAVASPEVESVASEAVPIGELAAPAGEDAPACGEDPPAGAASTEPSSLAYAPPPVRWASPSAASVSTGAASSSPNSIHASKRNSASMYFRMCCGCLASHEKNHSMLNALNRTDAHDWNRCCCTV
jgi:hypothetical protein